MTGIALQAVVKSELSCSDLSDLLWHLFLFDMVVGLRYVCALWSQDGVNFLLLPSTLKWAELHSFCFLPSSSSEGSFSFPSLCVFLVSMPCCNRISQWKSKLPLFQSVNISWNNMLSFEILSREHLKTSLPLSMSHLIRAAFPLLLFKPLPGNLVKAIRI